MREHFRFLRAHRKVLQLKLNAAEDLLLNGARDPTHRGVCQHLLDKVSRARVTAAAERLDPAARSRLLAGIVRMSPDVPYLLSYLESLKGSTSRQEATAALWQALERIDFSEVAAAHMRRVLELIAELFDARDRPQLVFGLLQSKSFRDSFDRSTDALPAELAESFVPLRAAHGVLTGGGSTPHGSAVLGEGVRMLLSVRDGVLQSHRAPLRRRLFELGAGFAPGRAAEFAVGLGTLTDCFDAGSRERSDAMLRMAELWLGSGDEAQARRWLTRLTREYPAFRLPVRWLRALDAPRFGRFALLDDSASKRGGASRFRPALDLGSQRPVWLALGDAADASEFAQAAALWRRLPVPSLAPVVEQGISADGVPFLAVPRMGVSLASSLQRPEADLVLAMAHEAACVLAALANAGVELPDVRFDRFMVSPSGRLWLRDLLYARGSAVEQAHAAHAPLAKALCRDLLRRAKTDALLDAALLERLDAATSCASLALLLAPWCGGPAPEPPSATDR